MKIRSYEVAFIILLMLSIIIPTRIRSCHFDNTIKRIPEYTSDVNVDLPVLPELQHFSADQHDFLYMGYMDLKEYEEEFSYVIDSISFLLSEGNCDPDYYSALFDELPTKYDEDYSDWFLRENTGAFSYPAGRQRAFSSACPGSCQ